MNVSCNDQRWIQLNQVWLSDKNLLRFFDEHLYLLLGKIYWFDSEIRSVSSDVVAHFKEGVDDVVQLVMVDGAGVDSRLGLVAGGCPGLPPVLKSVCAHI